MLASTSRHLEVNGVRLRSAFDVLGGVAVLAAVAVVLFLPTSALGSSPIVVRNTGNSGAGSLRQAILDANSSGPGNTIAFNIPRTDPGFNGQWFTITPVPSLPPLTAGGTTVDGGSQTLFTGDTNPAGPEVEISGGAASPPAFGLVVASANNVIEDLVIDRFQPDGSNHGGNGIDLQGPGNTVTGSYIGIDPTGTTALPNGSAGIGIAPGAGTGTRIGGTTAAERNVISGNTHYGVLVLIGDDGTLIEGNFIGTNAAGNAAVQNGFNPGSGDGGIHLQSNGNRIVANLISGNRGQAGIFCCGPSPGGTGNVIEGNMIGTDASGTAPVPNETGVVIGHGGATIGGTSPAARNLISGNRGNGIEVSGAAVSIVGNYIGTDEAGAVALPNGTRGGNGITVFGFGAAATVTVGGTAAGAGNLISGNAADGVLVQGGSPSTFPAHAVVDGNLIGTDAAGIAAVPNRFSGVELSGPATQAVVGGTAVGARNVISGNRNGVSIDNGASNQLVEGNYIGTDITGTAPVPNNWGVSVQSSGSTASNNAIVGNLLSGNDGFGVFVGQGAAGTSVRGNLIGTDASGTTAVGNGFTTSDCCGGGVRVNDGGADVTIGGASSADRNVISGNKIGVGVIGATRVAIEGNYIGTDVSGTQAVGNARNEEAGVRFFSQVTNSTILGNVIAGNGSAGIGVTSDPDHSTTGNTITGNWIGTAVGGSTALPNLGPGILIGDRVSQNLFGSNVIAFNAGSGIVALGGTSNTISQNSIFLNDGLGIDLGGDGVTPNDPGDVDIGPNNFQNFPVLNSALVSSGHLAVKGTIDTPSPQTAVLEFFGNSVPVPSGDPSGYGEGATFLGTATPAPDGTFTAVLPSVAPGTLISATATDAAGNTSEFAQDVTAVTLPTSEDQCKKGGWESFGVFKNQGDCVSYVATAGKNTPG